MHLTLHLTAARAISSVLPLIAWALLAPTVANGQSKPTVTVVNPVASPVNARITNTIVPVEIRNADPVPVAARDQDAGKYTHVGQKPGQIVKLGVSRTVGSRVDSLGNHLPFAVPAGYFLVVTDIEWEADCPPDSVVTFTLRSRDPIRLIGDAVSGSSECITVANAAYVERHYTTGQVFTAGQTFTAEAIYRLNPMNFEYTNSVSARVHGYLVPVN